jgi:hypothetical protein
LIYICFLLLFGLRRFFLRTGEAVTLSDHPVDDDVAARQEPRRQLVMTSRAMKVLSGNLVRGVVAAVFVLQALILVGTFVLVAVLELQGVRREVTVVPPNQVFLAVVALAAAAFYSALVILGAVRMMTNVQAALTWFKRATLVNLLAVQPFHVYENQVAALLGLTLNCVAYLVLQAVLQRPVGQRARSGSLGEGVDSASKRPV